MSLPTRAEAHTLLNTHVTDPYQRHHAYMVAVAMEGYAKLYNEDADLWYVTGLLHDLDFEQHPTLHPGPSLAWFAEWGYPQAVLHAVEAHAYGYNGFTTLPQSKLAAALIACDEMCGLLYAYQKINPVPYGDMKTSSLLKRFKEKTFAAKIDRELVLRGCDALGVSLEEHVANSIAHLQPIGISVLE